jgi:hypothetical protein
MGASIYCVFMGFRCKSYRGSGIFACFVVMWSAKPVSLHGFGAEAIGFQVFLHVLWPCSRQTMCFCMVCGHVAGEPCIFTWFRRKGYRLLYVFTCFEDKEPAKHIFLHGFGANKARKGFIKLSGVLYGKVPRGLIELALQGPIRPWTALRGP